jgi:hypothetical protein
VSGIDFREKNIDIDGHQAFDLAPGNRQLVASNAKQCELASEFLLIGTETEKRTEGHVPGNTTETIQIDDPHVASS